MEKNIQNQGKTQKIISKWPKFDEKIEKGSTFDLLKIPSRNFRDIDKSLIGPPSLQEMEKNRYENMQKKTVLTVSI